MLTNKHTPGPWVARAHKTDDGSPYFFIAAGGDNGWKGQRYMSVSGCIDIHDARLIAAAPDMLQALLDALDLAEVAAGRMDSYDRQAIDMDRRTGKIRAAIAKATGGDDAA